MKSRLLTLLIALTTGAIAVAMVAMYVNNVEKESIKGSKTRSVLVASRSLPKGMAGDDIVRDRAFEVEEIPSRYVLPGALTAPDALAGLVLSNPIAAGEQITSQRFQSSKQDAFLAEFPDGTEALSLPLVHVRGVAGHLKAGDRMNAYVTADAKKAAAEYLQRSSIPSSVRVFDAQESGATVLLLQEILVQEVKNGGSSDESLGAGDQASGTMTLAVTAEEAALLIHAQEKSKLWFTLVPPEETT